MKIRKTVRIFSSPNGPFRFPHRLVSSLPMCPVGQGHLSLSLISSNNLYKWDHLDLNEHRSVCVLYACIVVGVLVSSCGCSLLPRTSFHFEVRMELRTGLKTSVGVGIDVSTCVWVLCPCT